MDAHLKIAIGQSSATNKGVRNAFDMVGDTSPSLLAPDNDGSLDGQAVPASSIPVRNLQDLRHAPHDLACMRQRLFEIQDKLELQVHEFEQYWPYVDNVWVRQHRAGADKSGRFSTDYYACRLQRPTYTPKADTPRREGQPTRKKQIREGGTCQMRVKTVRYDGGYSSYTITRIGEQTKHTHDLNHIDKTKRNSVLMEVARSEVMKGYMPASVFTVMNEDIEKIIAAGGRFLNRNDIRNASQHWRQAHRDGLKVHDGYKYDHGNGIVKQDEESSFKLLTNQTQKSGSTLTKSLRLPPGTLHFPERSRAFLQSYLPPEKPPIDETGLPHVTLTYATSMESSLALAPGMQTLISGPESKAMTHYLRSKHEAIIIGVGTAIADDPALNCRLEGAGGFGGKGWERQPRPIIIDPRARWLITPGSKVLQAVLHGQGRGPWVIMAPGFDMEPMRQELVKYYGGKYLGLTEFDQNWRLRWEAILKALAAEGIKSVMIEGGGTVINSLLQPENASLVSSVIITIAPTYLGSGSVRVGPASKHDQTGRPQPAMRFREVMWQPLGEDVVMCGKLPITSGLRPQAPVVSD